MRPETEAPTALMPLPFAKMHGCANDYVVVNASRHAVVEPASLARSACDRRTGIGADGLLLVSQTEGADFAMRMFNVDGSEAEMCGNGLRCAARFALEEGLISGPGPFTAQTGNGPLELELADSGASVTVAMGTAQVQPVETLDVAGRALLLTPVSIGNPHAVVFVDDIDAVPIAELGPAIETHARFPNRTNVEFVQVLGRDAIRQRTWERGCGETPACGTGACAAAAAAVAGDRAERALDVHLVGGTLAIEIAADGAVRMRGPAVRVFDGEWPTGDTIRG